MSRSGGSDWQSDESAKDSLKPLVSCRPNKPSVDPRVMCRVQQTADELGCSELEAACIVIHVLHEALEVYGLAQPLSHQPS